MLKNLIGAAMAGAAAVVAILALMLPLWFASNFTLDYAPRLVASAIIDKTPPDNAIALQTALGALSLPFAILGGVMFAAIFGIPSGLAYNLLKGYSRLLAGLVAMILTPVLTWVFFSNQTVISLAPLLLTGFLVDRVARRDPPLTETTPGITRRQVLTRLAAFSVGGLAVSVIAGLPVYLSERDSVRAIYRRLFAFTPPAPRQPGFDMAELSPEVTPIEYFYMMRKFPTPIPANPPNWALTIDGLVDQPLVLTLAELIALPKQDAYLTRQCVSSPVGGRLISTALMSGTALAEVLKRAGVKPETTELIFYGRDGYSENVRLQYAIDHGLLVYAMNGVFLPEAHGAPVKVELPGLYGFKNMKWLDRIEAVSAHTPSVWEQEGWTREAVVKTMSRIDAIIPGSKTTIVGIAFAGRRGISKVEVQVNGGEWQSATLHTPALSEKTWVQWRTETATTGRLTVSVRAVDGTGIPQIAKQQAQFPDGASGYHTVAF